MEVGIDESGNGRGGRRTDPAHSREAVRYALAEAARRGARVVAVWAFQPPETWVEGYEIIVTPSLSEVTDNIEARTRQLVCEVAEELGGDAAKVPFDVVGLVGSPAKALLDRASAPDLLVVGHRGRGALASTVLGSVGLRCVLQAPCPVTIVPAVPVGQRADEPVADAIPKLWKGRPAEVGAGGLTDLVVRESRPGAASDER